jgi:hypothetical protein
MKENLVCEQRDRGLRLFKLICKPTNIRAMEDLPRFLAMSAKKKGC